MELTKNQAVLDWIDQQVALTKPDQVIWIDGSEAQLEQLRHCLLYTSPWPPPPAARRPWRW